MVPTIRLVRFIAVGSPLWLLALAFPAAGIAGVVYLLVLCTLCIADYRSTPDAAGFEFERVFGRFSLASATDVHILLKNRSTHTLTVSMRDELPTGLQQVAPMPELILPGNYQFDAVYRIQPLRRGRFNIETLALRIGRPGAFLQRQVRIFRLDKIRVYPRFSTAGEYHLLSRTNPRDENVRRPRRVQGRGTDFESLSQYYPGDDLRSVDWKISAKRGHLVTRNLQIERGQQISVLIDGGRLMAGKIGDYSRFEHALNAAVMLCYVAQQRGDAVAVSTFSDRIESFVPPIRGKAIMPRVMESLSTVEVRQVEADYWYVVGQLMDRLKRRSLLIMMTDVLDPAGSNGLLLNLSRAAARHLVLCIVLTEPAIGGIAESEPDTVEGTYLKAAACYLKQQRQLALDKMRSRGIMTLEAAPENVTVQLIRRYLEIRKANLQ